MQLLGTPFKTGYRTKPNYGN